MSERFPKDTYVVYGKTGVCRVVDRREMAFSAPGGEEYYVLSPSNDPRSFVYVPCANEQLLSRMRPLLTKQEIDTLLDNACQQPLEWPEDKAERQILFREMLSGGECGELLRLIRCLYEKRVERLAAGKRLSTADESLLQDAIRLLEQEFSYSLELTRPQVADYIRDRLENK